jgi:hypothetical protein
MYGWTRFSRIPQVPTGSTNHTAPHFVLYLGSAANFNGESHDHWFPDWRSNIQVVTIVLGWREPWRPKYEITPTGYAQAIRCVLAKLRNWNMNVEVILSPYIEVGDHLFCFPKRRPQGPSGHSRSFKGITFQSNCSCEQGDTTGSKSGNGKRILLITANCRPLDPALA